MQSHSLHRHDAVQGFGCSPTSVLQRKISRCIYVCIACERYEASQRDFQIWKLFCNQDRPFSSSTWSGRLFFCTKIFEFATAANRASWCQLTSFESDFSNPTSKTIVGLRQNPIFSTQTVPTAYLNRRWISKFLVEKIVFEKSSLIHSILRKTGTITSGFSLGFS